ncbi:Lipid phosphate phosphatase 1 [Fulvia fulva]|uniref:Lipid phosphate phosphatase 1 n=1 Tax=Passalora fulva TaxID=5499 RepID=A0A9Q8L7T9_PASFU|nr:Lipid phosphate phosphatase 1 [Fulvia fulva]KAK4634354.1 Lipid phosphate phosphatase 1 [Fulvia fulva]KAK4636391.1 Lipid phosphate phosphatase 1 [Fulvia fulva]UJO12409.1 Lipid phosphate phosphatase 1 [Fulvia fulva]WPV09490.1 Lipid phosphate phosphatase 1 [Fulvia fulva]WPV25275.1 Lipid phosphate phosphatase 1 [Fulvia fulva]
MARMAINKGTLLGATGKPSKKLVVSYLFDWFIIIVFAAAGAGLSKVRPHHRPFSLLNLEISNPVVDEQISIWMLGVIAFVVPAAIIALITLIFVPGGNVRRVSTTSQVIKLKLWELEKGLAGLCLSVAVAFFITQGMKNMFGKPRPNLIAKCQPDLSNIGDHVVGGYGQDLSISWTLVDFSICTQPDIAFLDDGFRSFPSGHSSWSWSGLLYLTLYFCSKFAIGLPHLPTPLEQQQQQQQPLRSTIPQNGDHELLPLHSNRARGDSEDTKREEDTTYRGAAGPSSHHPTSDDISTSPLWMRNAAAAPPNYLIIPALLPVAVAVYICSTRYVEFYHFGFDIISGSLIGIATAYLSFRWYHLPISRGQGWAWGARSRNRAFAIGVGTGGYVGEEGWETASGGRGKGRDVEAQGGRA